MVCLHSLKVLVFQRSLLYKEVCPRILPWLENAEEIIPHESLENLALLVFIIYNGVLVEHLEIFFVEVLFDDGFFCAGSVGKVG